MSREFRREIVSRKIGRPQRFDKELRVYVTSDQYMRVAEEADAEQREVSNMVRVLLNEALNARVQEAAMPRAGESSA